jgi:regulator of sigma E protease
MSLKMLGKMITAGFAEECHRPDYHCRLCGPDGAHRPGKLHRLHCLHQYQSGRDEFATIPVLDGGHLLYYSLEVLTGRPLPERVGEIAQRLGIGLLLTLMVLAVFNDVLRLIN